VLDKANKAAFIVDKKAAFLIYRSFSVSYKKN